MLNLVYELDRIELFDKFRCILIDRSSIILCKASEDGEYEIQGRKYTKISEKSMTPERWAKELIKNVKNKGESGCIEKLSQ